MLSLITVIIAVLLIAQGLFTLFWMLYAWEEPDRIEANKSPRHFQPPRYSFTAIIPARHEEKVIADTLRAMVAIRYPDDLREVLVICRADDTATIRQVKEMIAKLNQKNIYLVIFDDDHINKPHALNIGLLYAEKDIVVVFDAEDEPHPDIYHIANTMFCERGCDVLQSGVQLMNVRSRWFSALNAMEYYFWFKSALHFFSRSGLILLGGNSSFIKRDWLKRLHGWDEDCLTEDADMGIRLSRAGAKFNLVYDEQHVTREETPSSVRSFIQQRTRWNQGFLQILLKPEWRSLTTLPQKLLAGYILLLPEIQAAALLIIPLSLIMTLTTKVSVLDAMLSIFPLYLLVMQLLVYNLGLYEFTLDYGQHYSFLFPLKVALSYYPFQILLGVSALRAIYRVLRGHTGWEKTQHINAHRNFPNNQAVSYEKAT